MKKYHPGLTFSLIVIVLISWLTSCSSTRTQTARNIIFMVGDGMGLANVTAARIYKNGFNGSPLCLETLPVIGYQRTYSKNSLITDSASAASAWACGEKFNNGEICQHSEDGSYLPSILEIAKNNQKGTGLIATSTITHATPAAFGAHVKDRTCQNEIARQYIRVTKPDVILGGGRKIFNSTIPDTCGTFGNFLSEALENGYTVVYTKRELEAAISKGRSKLLGLFNDQGMVPEHRRPSDTTEPRLHEMTAAALTILEEKPKGFFLLIEGSQIDWGNHRNHLEYVMKEVVAFDEAVKVVLKWINEKPSRKQDTLLIITSDHETGGFAILGSPNGLPIVGELNSIGASWITPKHTGTDTLIWSQGPGSKNLGKIIENTELYRVMSNALR